MRKIFTALFLLAGLFAGAQSPGIDIYGGVAVSRLHGETESHGYLASLTTGLRLKLIKLSDALSIHLEANFTQQGGGYEIPNIPSDEGHRGKLKLNYINVPVTARYESKGGLYAEVGMQAGVLLSAKDKLYQLAVEERDVKEFAKELDYALIAGVGYRFRGRLGLGMRVIPGLSLIFEDENTYWENEDRNLVMSVFLTYSFTDKKKRVRHTKPRKHDQN
jgi:hypothetical protein